MRKVFLAILLSLIVVINTVFADGGIVTFDGGIVIFGGIVTKLLTAVFGGIVT